MSKTLRSVALMAAVVGLAAPALAPAWTPYNSPPQAGQAPAGDAGAPMPYGMGRPPFPGYGQGYPMGPSFSGYGPPTGFDQPPTAGTEGGAPGGFGPYGMPPGYPQGGMSGPRPGMQISRRMTDNAYLIDIQLRGISPDEVQVRTEGRWLTIDRGSSAEEVRQESFDQGRGYARSFSYSSGSATRRMSLPPDADLAAMQREEGEDRVTISIPRTGYAAPQGADQFRR